MEAVRGKVSLASVQMSDGIKAFRFYDERKDIRNMIGLEKLKIFKILGKLNVAKKRGEVKKFIEDEEEGIKNVLLFMRFFNDLMNHMVYDIAKIKKILMKIYNLDQEVKSQRFPKDSEQKLEKEILGAWAKINSVLRTESDVLGALSKK